MALSIKHTTGLRARQAFAAKPAHTLRPLVRCNANKDEEKGVIAKLAVPVAAVVTATMLLNGVAAPEALAARSGGRAGASGFSARRAAAPSYSRAAPARAQVNNYHSTTVVSAPPVYSSFSPLGYGGFGFGGFRIMPVVPIPFFGGLLQFMFLMLLVGFVFNVVRGAIDAANSGSKSKSQDWDDL